MKPSPRAFMLHRINPINCFSERSVLCCRPFVCHLSVVCP